ncbi:MAG TPA: hypothetical protein VM123_15025 [archaeon]|nr:hypothetical protein [archaeon]
MLSLKLNRLMTIAGMLLLCSMVIFPYTLEAQRRGGSNREGGQGRPGDMSQRMQDRQKQAEQRFEMICDSLKLDETQRKEAHKLFKDTQKEREKIFEDISSGALVREEAQSKMREINQSYLEKFTALLNEDQREKYRKIQEEWRAQRPGRR